MRTALRCLRRRSAHLLMLMKDVRAYLARWSRQRLVPTHRRRPLLAALDAPIAGRRVRRSAPEAVWARSACTSSADVPGRRFYSTVRDVSSRRRRAALVPRSRVRSFTADPSVHAGLRGADAAGFGRFRGLRGLNLTLSSIHAGLDWRGLKARGTRSGVRGPAGRRARLRGPARHSLRGSCSIARVAEEFLRSAWRNGSPSQFFGEESQSRVPAAVHLPHEHLPEGGAGAPAVGDAHQPAAGGPEHDPPRARGRAGRTPASAGRRPRLTSTRRARDDINIRLVESRSAVDGNRECGADLTHVLVTEPAQTFDQHSVGHTLDQE